MTISEKLFLYLILFGIGAEYACCTRQYRQEFDNFNSMNAPSPNFIPSGLGQSHVQVQAVSGKPRSRWNQWEHKTSQSPITQQPMWNTWEPNASTPPATQPTWNQWTSNTITTPPKTPSSSTQPSSNPLPHPPKSMHRARRKFGHGLQQDPIEFSTEKSRELFTQRDKTIAHISAKLQPYFMSAVVHDFSIRLWNTSQDTDVLLRPNELAAIDNQCEKCTVAELQSLLTILLTIMEKYPPLNTCKNLTEHLAAEYERASDYLDRKLENLRSEIADMYYDSDFRDIVRRYARRERNGGIMCLLLEWYESYALTGQDDEQELRQKLLKRLTAQKRYWLISIKGVL